MFAKARLRLRKPPPGTVLGGLALIVAMSGVAVAAIPGADGTVTACLLRDGSLHVIDVEAGDTCRKKETTVQLASTDSAGKVRNADTVDGRDSTAFQEAHATAGGDLSGAYPSPSVRTGAIKSSQVDDWSLRMRDIATDGMYISFNLDPLAAGACKEIQTGDAKSDTYVTWPIAPDQWPHDLTLEPMMSSRNAAGQLERQFRVCNRSAMTFDPPEASLWAFSFDF